MDFFVLNDSLQLRRQILKTNEHLIVNLMTDHWHLAS